MAEFDQILTLWKEGRSAGEDVCLATIVRTEGSSYRKAGTRMLLSPTGRHAGTISGGCLEAEVQKKAWWLTRNGASVERYNSFFEDDSDIPFGLGCGGTVWVLLERGPVVDATLSALASGAEQSRPCVIGAVSASDATVSPGTRLILGHDGAVLWADNPPAELERLAHCVLQQRTSAWQKESALFFADYAAPPQRLFLFGAGDDAQPVAAFAAALGWQVTVIDGRAHLATIQRFPSARAVRVFHSETEAAAGCLSLHADDAVVVMTHSFAQDRAILHLLRHAHVGYLGVLGPRQRTQLLMQEVGGEKPNAFPEVHTPIGLKIGSKGPAEIALAIIAEIQSVMSRRIESRLPAEAPSKSSAA